MRSPPVSTWVLLGVGGGIAAMTYRKLTRTRHRRPAMIAEPARAARRDRARDRASRRALDREPTVIPNSYARDPADPVQGLDDVHEFHLDDLDVDALSAAEVEADLDETLDGTLDDALDAIPVPTLDMIEMAARDIGDRYRGLIAPAVDRHHPDDRTAMDQGQNWIEALEASAIEDGATPERDLTDIVDDTDVYAPPHPPDTRDIPVADRGSGGRGGI